MSVLQSRNPAMGAFERFGDDQIARSEERSTTMTIGGTVTATSMLLAVVAFVGVLVWQAINSQFVSTGSVPGWAMLVTFGSAIAGLLVSLVIAFKPKTAPFMAFVHAGLEGAFVGGFTFLIPMWFLGGGEAAAGGTNPSAMIALQAAVTTFAVAGAMLAGYATGVLRVGPLVQKVMMTALFGLIGYTALIWILGFFGVGIWNGYADTGAMGIGFTVLCAGLASLFLLLDFQFIEQGVKAKAPKYMEWVGAWGLMVTLVWLYIELVRLFAKLRSE